MSGSPDGRVWYQNPKCKEKIVEELDRSGIPLELKSENILIGKGYRCIQLYYSDKVAEEGDTIERKFRELDIYALKTQRTFKISDCEVDFQIRLFGECKYRKDGTYIAFENEDKYLPTMPITFHGRGMTHNYYRDFIVPIIIRKISEFDLKGMKPSGDKDVVDASHQLMNACNYMYLKNHKGFQRTNYYNIKRSIEREFSVSSKEDILAKCSDIDIIRKVPIFQFILSFCILILDNDSGLMMAKYDGKQGKVIEIEDIGYGIYPFVSPDADKYENLLNNRFSFPIFISDVGHLDNTIDAIEKGVSKMSATIEQIILREPHNLAKLILDEMFSYSWETDSSVK